MTESRWTRWIRWTRGDQTLLEGLLVLSLVGVLVFGVAPTVLGYLGVGMCDRAALETCADVITLEAPLERPPALPELAGAAGAAGVQVTGPYTVTLVFPDPTPGQRLTHLAVQLGGSLLALAVLALLLQIARSLRKGDPFTPGNARRVLAISLLVGVGGILVQLLEAVVRIDLITSTVARNLTAPGAELSLLPLYAGVLLGFLAQVMRVGARMREDLEGVV